MNFHPVVILRGSRLSLKAAQSTGSGAENGCIICALLSVGERVVCIVNCYFENRGGGYN